VVSFLRGLQPYFLCISHIPHSCYLPRPLHLPWLNHPNNISWRVKVMNLPIMQSSYYNIYIYIYMCVCVCTHTHIYYLHRISCSQISFAGHYSSWHTHSNLFPIAYKKPVFSRHFNDNPFLVTYYSGRHFLPCLRQWSKTKFGVAVVSEMPRVQFTFLRKLNRVLEAVSTFLVSAIVTIYKEGSGRKRSLFRRYN
jgi:hypothetical protein